MKPGQAIRFGEGEYYLILGEPTASGSIHVVPLNQGHATVPIGSGTVMPLDDALGEILTKDARIHEFRIRYSPALGFSERLEEFSRAAQRRWPALQPVQWEFRLVTPDGDLAEYFLTLGRTGILDNTTLPRALLNLAGKNKTVLDVVDVRILLKDPLTVR